MNGQKLPPNKKELLGFISKRLRRSFVLQSIDCGFNLRVEPTVQIAIALVDESLYIFRHLTKSHLLSLVQRCQLAILVEPAFLLQGVEVGLEHGFDSVEQGQDRRRQTFSCRN